MEPEATSLRALLPEIPAARSSPAHTLLARQRHLEAELRRPARRGPVRVGVLATALGVTLIGGTAAAIGAWAPATAPNSARCYTTLSTDEGDDFPGTTVTRTFAVGESEDTSPWNAAEAIETCAAVWRAGAFGPGDNLVLGNYSVPELTACRLDNGMPGVFPGDTTTCATLGYPRLATS